MSAEYSPVRHRAAIERVLAAAQGADPKLDSAPKVWTTFAVAKHLDIVGSPLTDYFVTWLRAFPNSVFLEVLTEASHIMADHLQVYDLERDTFAMLVGEEALDSMHRAKVPEANRKRSTFGRKKEDLPEHIQTRVEYASQKLTERVASDFDQLQSVGWIESLPEVQKLLSYTQPELQDHVSKVNTLLHDWVQGAIQHILRSLFATVPDTNLPVHGGEELLPRVERQLVFNRLSPEERILTRTFWNALETSDLFGGATNLDIIQGWPNTAELAPIVDKPAIIGVGYHRVQKVQLIAAIQAGQGQLMKLRREGQKVEDVTHTKTNLALRTFSTESGSYVPQEVAKRFNSLPFRPKSPVGEKSSLPTVPTSVYSTHLDAPDYYSPGAVPQPWEDVVPEYSKLSVESEKQSCNDQIDDLPETSDTTPLLGKENLPFGTEPYEDLASPQHSKPEPRAVEPQEHLPIFPETPKFFDLANFFSLGKFFYQAEDHIRRVTRSKLHYTDQMTRKEPYELLLLNTLVCLEDTEFQYLPLWAGGNDDGTGGVFQEDVPMPDVSFSTAGPSIHHGAAMHTISECDSVSIASGAGRDINIPTTSAPSSAYHMVNGAGSTNPSSNATVAGSYSTHLHRGQVYAADSVDDSSDTGDCFSVVARSEGMNPDNDEEENARRQIEAMERIEAAEQQSAQDKKAAVPDENYADLFGSEDDYQFEDEGNESDDTMTAEYSDCGSDVEDLMETTPGLADPRYGSV